MPTSYLGDSLLVSKSEKESTLNVLATVQLFRSLGFIVYPEKFISKPAQQIPYLGVISESESVTVMLKDGRKASLTEC